MNGNGLFNRSHIAKKEHTCYLCGGTIKPREKYKQLGYIIDAHLVVNKLHRHCYDNIFDFCCKEDNYDHEWTKQDVLDDMYQKLSDKAEEDGDLELGEAAYNTLLKHDNVELVDLYERHFGI